VAGLLLVAAAPLRAVDAPARPPASALGLIQDLRLTVLARRAFQDDRVLRPLNLGVKVRNGVATVWGPVPSKEVARQVVARLEAINGIEEVRSELQVRRPPQKPLLPELGIPRGTPKRIEVAKPADQRPAAMPTAGQDRRPGPLPELNAQPLPGPQPAKKAVVTSRPAPPLSVAIERVRQSEGRFRGIPVELRGDVVVITRTGADEDVMALAQALRRVRGVAEVIVASD
jgi:hypothetical protein